MGLLDGAGGGAGGANGGAKAPEKKVDGRDGGRVEVGPTAPGNGTVVLRVRPPSKSEVRITAVSGSFKETWNSSGVLELVGLPAGKYKTKVSPKGGKSFFSTFEVKDNQACELTLDIKSSTDWNEGECGEFR